MNIVYQADALADLDDIYSYIAKDNSKIASSVVSRIKASVERLKILPRSGRPGIEDGTRELVVPALPYIVVYELNEEVVEIIAVFHQARNR